MHVKKRLTRACRRRRSALLRAAPDTGRYVEESGSELPGGAFGNCLSVIDRCRRPPAQTTIISADAIFSNDFGCSFALQEQVKGMYRDTLYFDNNSTLSREFISPQFQGPLTVTWTNLETGTSLTSHEASTLIIDYNPDGSFQKLANQGLTFHVSVGGEGLLLADVGRIVIKRGQGSPSRLGHIRSSTATRQHSVPTWRIN